jgi:hypothetical protein
VTLCRIDLGDPAFLLVAIAKEYPDCTAVVRIGFKYLHGDDVLALKPNRNSSPNFLWFKECRQAFLYVDRIILAATTRRPEP